MMIQAQLSMLCFALLLETSISSAKKNMRSRILQVKESPGVFASHRGESKMWSFQKPVRKMRILFTSRASNCSSEYRIHLPSSVVWVHICNLLWRHRYITRFLQVFVFFFLALLSRLLSPGQQSWSWFTKVSLGFRQRPP